MRKASIILASSKGGWVKKRCQDFCKGNRAFIEHIYFVFQNYISFRKKQIRDDMLSIVCPAIINWFLEMYQMKLEVSNCQTDCCPN